jgi:C4-dicarboxylate transporter, DctQ subunit
MKRGKKMGKSLDKIISKIEETVLSYSVILMAIILIGSILSRKLFNASWTFSEEAGQFLTLIVTFFGISYGAKKGRQITMSAIFDVVDERGKKIFTLLTSSVSCISMIYISYYAVLYTLKVHELGRVSPSMRIPMEYIILIVPLGFLFGAIEYGRTFVKNLRGKETWLSTEVTIRDYQNEKEGKDGKEEIIEADTVVDMNKKEVKC